MFKKNLKLITFFVLLFLLLGANFVYALEINYPRVPGADPPQDFIDKAPSGDILSLYIKYFVYLFIWISGFLAFAMLVYGGIGYLMSSGSPEKMVNAKQQISGAFLGLLLLLSAFLILNTINPNLTKMNLESLYKINIPIPPGIHPPDTKKITSSIDVELPFGRIIESIFETYDFTKHPDKRDKEYVPRMLRITNNVRAVISDDHKVGLADMLLEQSIGLKNLANKCSCRDTEPVNPCGGIKSGDITWQCGCSGCGSTKPVTCDPCASVRSEIQNTEEKNIDAVYNGVEIKQLTVDEKKKTITTSLTQEIIKTEEEMRLLKEELYRLERVEQAINTCSGKSLASWKLFTAKEDAFAEEKQPLEKISFWDNINIKYYPKKYSFFYTGRILFTDYATFYCSVGGTIYENPFSSLSFDDFDETKMAEDISEEELEALLDDERIACTNPKKEAPVGEIIDRTKRVTQLLIDKLEALVGWEKKLINAVDELQVLISQCSSQRGCERRCTCFACLCKHHSDCIAGCKGWAFSCADSSPAYPGTCLDRDEDTPCPYKEINEQIKKIEEIYQEIADIIEGKEDKDTPDTIGIMNIVDEFAPTVINELETKVRNPMNLCSGTDFYSQEEVLFNAEDIVDQAIIPGGKSIRKSCQIYKMEGGVKTQTPYGDCFEECYLEKTQDEHRKCVQECLNKSSDEELKECINELNFYCCNI